MKKQTAAAALVAAPTIVSAATPAEIATNVRVVDAGSGETIARVIEANADAGTVRRFAVEDGNLVRKDDEIVVIEEERAIRIEWIEPPVPETVPVEADGAQG